jgi:hypothetical protein
MPHIFFTPFFNEEVLLNSTKMVPGVFPGIFRYLIATKRGGGNFLLFKSLPTQANKRSLITGVPSVSSAQENPVY